MARKENASFEKQNQRTPMRQESGITNANDLTPTYTVPATASELKSGERLTVAMGKLARAVIDLIAHIADKNNPHGVSKSQLSLDKVDNTSDADKPISTATQAALNNKVDKVTGKGLSANDYTTAEKTKLGGIEEGAQVNTITGVKGDNESAYRTGNVNITKANIGLGNVENKSSETIRGEITKKNVTDALGYTPPEQDTVYEHPESGVSAGTFRSVTVNQYGHVTGGSNPNTLAGYGITDAESKGTAASAVSVHNTSDSAHSDIRALITALQNTVSAFLDVDDSTKDQLSEVLALIEDNKDLIEGITTSKVSVSDIVNNLTTNSSGKVLSAAQGVAIKALIDALQTEVDKKALASDLKSHTGDTTVHITATERTNWNAAYSSKHEHSNKSVLDGITSALITKWNSAVTHISDAAAHITATERTNWNDANSKKHEHSNKSVLDGITSTLITAWNAAKTAVDKLGSAAYTDSSDYAAAEHAHDYLPLSGGTLTGNLSGKYFTGTWLQTTEAANLNSKPSKIAVLDASGWIYYRTPEELLSDIGASASGGESSSAAVYSVTLPASGWSDTSPYEQTVTVTGITADDEPIVMKYKSVDMTEAESKAYETAFGIVCSGMAETLAGQVRWVCFTKPETDITVGLICA